MLNLRDSIVHLIDFAILIAIGVGIIWRLLTPK